MSKEKVRTVNYRRCVAEAPGTHQGKNDFNLQSQIEAAAQKVKRPWIRAISADGTRSQFLAYLVAKQGCLCGTLVLYEKGRKVPLVDAEPDGTTWEGYVAPKDDKGKERKLQEQALYFAIRENHVAVIQTKELAIQELQDFLVWFIQSSAQLVPNWLFVLQNLPSKVAFEKLKNHPIKGIKIGKNAFSVEKVPTPESEGKKRKRYTQVVKPDPLIMALLRKLTENDDLLDDLESTTDPGSIMVEVDIRYKSRSVKSAQRVMQSIAATLGGQDGLNPEIQLDGKSKIKADELTIKDTVSVQCPDGNVSADDAMTRLSEWLIASIRSHKVLS